MAVPSSITHLRHPNAGSPKDWIIQTFNGHLEIFFGKTDQGLNGPRFYGDTTGLQKRVVTSTRPLQDTQERIQDKFNKGYLMLDRNGHQPSLKKQAQSKPGPNFDPVSEWENQQTTYEIGGTSPMSTDTQTSASNTPTVQNLFHESFPPIPWEVRTTHEWERYVPIPTPEYRFRPDITADVLGWLSFGSLSALITGPTGSGKSSLVNEIAGRSNIPVFPVVGHHRLEWLDLVGQYVPNSNGSFNFEYGPLPNAMKAGGIFLIDELDLIDPSTLVAMNSVLDKRPLVLSSNSGEVIEPADGFRVVATSNSKGLGEGESEGYSGTLKLSKAFLNRLSWTFIFDYPSPDIEIEIVEKIIGNKDVSEKMVSLANEVRRIHQAEEAPIQDTLSTRELIEWSKAALFFRNVPRIKNPLAYALRTTVVNKASKEGQPIFKEIFQRVFNREL